MRHLTDQRLDYDPHATAYAASRRPNPEVLATIQQAVKELGARRVLEIGVGAGDVLSALSGTFERLGLDPSRGMLSIASQHGDLLLTRSFAEALPFADESIDLAYSVDVVHHIVDRNAAAREIARVLRPGGRALIATDSADDIAARVPLASHFPETVEVERKRYPEIGQIETELFAAGLHVEPTLHVAQSYHLTDITGYLTRSYSSLLLISEDAYQRGIERLRADLARGPIEAVSLYTIVRAVKRTELAHSQSANCEVGDGVTGGYIRVGAAGSGRSFFHAHQVNAVDLI
jgi:ubiquinone/menaquinone biosynthesis C-methylase UbiE